MLKIGGQKVPGLTLLLILSEALLIAAGLFLATILHFMDYAAVTTTLSTPNAFIRFVLVVLVCIVASTTTTSMIYKSLPDAVCSLYVCCKLWGPHVFFWHCYISGSRI